MSSVTTWFRSLRTARRRADPRIPGAGEGGAAMTDTFERGAFARAVFSGLLPSALRPSNGPQSGRHAAAQPPAGFRSARWRSGVMATVPIVLAGAMTVSLNLAGPADSASAAAKKPMKPKSELAKTLREILLTFGQEQRLGGCRALELHRGPRRQRVVDRRALRRLDGLGARSQRSELEVADLPGAGAQTVRFGGERRARRAAPRPPAPAGGTRSFAATRSRRSPGVSASPRRPS